MSKSLFIGSTVIRLDRLDSTNNYARELVRDKLPIEGTVVLAKHQTAGRGQRDRPWLSEADRNLTCSYILKPVFLGANSQFVLSAVVSLAVLETVSELIAKNDIKVKWPNDVLVDGKKIAGILIENMLRGTKIESSIVGVGLNVNQTDFPSDLNATSLKLEGVELDIEAVLSILNEKLEKYYLQMRELKFDSIFAALNNQLYGIDQRLELRVNGKNQIVRVLGVHGSGELELEHMDGARTLHQHHEIEWNLRP